MADAPFRHVVLLTGHLAEPRVLRLVAGLGPLPFHVSVVDIGVKVAALMTGDIIRRRLILPAGADLVVLPGRCRVDAATLSQAFGVAFCRGPDEIADLPRFLGRGALPPDLSGHDLRIFAEIVDAADLSPEALLGRADALRTAGADIIDLGCRPDTPFPGLADAVRMLKAAGHAVSVDSADPAELRTGAEAGADFLLSLTEATLDLSEGTAAIPVIVPATPGDLPSLERAARRLIARGRPFLADPILDPLNMGLADALVRYHAFRAAFPEAEMLMGTGNLTELTEADTGGLTALLVGLCGELRIRNVLVVQVSPHTRRTIEEHDAARRLIHAARRDGGLPKGYGAGLVSLHDMRPWPASPAEIAAQAAEVRDRNWRIDVAEDGIHLYNRDRHIVVRQAIEAFPHLDVADDGAHAYYLGTELMKAEIAFRLGKRYAQDGPLDWGVAAPKSPETDGEGPTQPGHTLTAGRLNRRGRDDRD